MRKSLFALALLSVAGAANAAQIVYSNIPATGTTGLGGGYGYTTTTTYQALAFDDYTMGVNTPVLMSSIRWVGGATVSGAQFTFSFFDASQTYVGGFTYAPSTTGYTVRAVDVSILNQIIPSSGFFQIGVSSATAGSAAIFAGTTANSVGSSSTSVGSFSGMTTPSNIAFEINGTPQAVPEPSAFAALGLGAVAMLRRRKRA